MRRIGEEGLRTGDGLEEAIGMTVEMLGSGSAPKGERIAVGESPKGGTVPRGCEGGDRRRLYGENAGSSHCGCGCSVNGGGMLSTGRAREKSTLGGGSVGRRMASKLRGRGCARAAALASSELSDASSG